MLTLDIIIIILVLYGGYHGYKKGLISQLFIFMIFFIFIYRGIFIFNFVKKINMINKNSNFFEFSSLIISFFSIIFLSFLIKKIIEYIITITWMTPVNNFFGGILGIIKYLFVISMFLFFLKETNKKINIIPFSFFQNSFEKEFQFFFSKKGHLLNKLKELYFYFQSSFSK
ncbi:CvpA family protein [Blattabacterium cuenoti]|uniref:CvpA family protein n=1 Tax=Blattabacterium cuenoti TaxID=1653831 RepID=UPI00163C3800|nr:CvpA family protein [Blattabacterium cuenoti]